MFQLLSQSVQSSPSPAVSTSLFSMSVSLLLYKEVHQYHLSRFHIYTFIYNVCFSLSDLLHFVLQTLGSSISLDVKFFCLVSFLFFILIYIFPVISDMLCGL